MTLLAGRVAVVTGASRGIGLAVARRLQAEGARVARLARTLRAGWHDGFLDLPCDLTEPTDLEHAVTQLAGQLGVPDLVVNNAGGFLLAALEETSITQFDDQIAINLRAPFLVARALIPRMREAGRGQHIAIGSIADHQAFPGNAGYAAAKHGLRGLHDVLRAECRGTGVRCTLVSPGPVDTAIWNNVDLQAAGIMPREAMLRPEDVADAVAFVATRPAHVEVDWLRLGPA